MMLAVAALAIGGASPAAASRAGCFAAAGHGAKKANRYSESGQAIVLRAHGAYYGCVFNRERLHKLKGQDDGGSILRDSVQVAGRYSAYGIVFGSDPTNTFVYSVRLWSGEPWARGTDRRWAHRLKWSENVVLSDLVLRGNGSVAWQFSWPAEGGGDPFTVVLGFDHNPSGGPRFHRYADDTGARHKIVPSSLDLLHDGLGATGWGITWRREGAAPPRRDIN